MLIAPLSGCSIQRKIRAVIITDAAHGAMSAHRATRLPGKRWLNSWARPSETSIVRPTTATTHSTVRTRMPGRFGSWKSLLKFLVPADPIVTPMAVMFCIDVWTSVTMGHSTTTAIRIAAGASQASGSRRRRIRRPRPAPRGRGEPAGALARPSRSPAVSPAAATCDMPASAAAHGGLLDRVQDLARAAGDRLAQGGLDLRLHGLPAGLGRVVH